MPIRLGCNTLLARESKAAFGSLAVGVKTRLPWDTPSERGFSGTAFAHAHAPSGASTTPAPRHLSMCLQTSQTVSGGQQILPEELLGQKATTIHCFVLRPLQLQNVSDCRTPCAQLCGQCLFLFHLCKTTACANCTSLKLKAILWNWKSRKDFSQPAHTGKPGHCFSKIQCAETYHSQEHNQNCYEKILLAVLNIIEKVHALQRLQRVKSWKNHSKVWRKNTVEDAGASELGPLKVSLCLEGHSLFLAYHFATDPRNLPSQVQLS